MSGTLITGGNGLLARYLEEVWQTEVHCLSHSQLDVTCFQDVRQALKKGSYDTVINCAGAARLSEEELLGLNAYAAENIAAFCARRNIRFIFLSTSRVFDGKDITPYTEEAHPNPKDLYGISKFIGEQLVQKVMHGGKFWIFRLPLVLGYQPARPDGCLASRLLRIARHTGKLQAATDMYHTPVHARAVAHAIVTVLKQKSNGGVFHLSGARLISVYDMFMALVEKLNISCQIQGKAGSAFSKEPYGPMQGLASTRLPLLMDDVLQDFADEFKP